MALSSIAYITEVNQHRIFKCASHCIGEGVLWIAVGAWMMSVLVRVRLQPYNSWTNGFFVVVAACSSQVGRLFCRGSQPVPAQDTGKVHTPGLARFLNPSHATLFPVFPDIFSARCCSLHSQHVVPTVTYLSFILCFSIGMFQEKSK